MNTFLVTSSINTLQSYGVYTPQERFEQTLETISSIRSYAKPAKIILMETTELSEDQRKELLQKVDLLCDFSENSFIRRLEDRFQDNYQLIKSPSEFYMLSHILMHKHVKEFRMFQETTEMMFKLSGRYKLTPRFAELEDQYRSITFLRRKPAVIYYDKETGEKISPEYKNNYYFPSRFFSFSYGEAKLLEYGFKKMLKYVLNHYKNNKFTDMEHTLAQFFFGVREVDELGITGNFATTGKTITE